MDVLKHFYFDEAARNLAEARAAKVAEEKELLLAWLESRGIKPPPSNDQ